MSHPGDMAALQKVARLLLDHRLSGLQAAAARREQSRMQIAALDRVAEPSHLPPVAAGQVALRYQLWADARRSELNIVLARQTAEWMAARDEARLAFGKLEALRGVAARCNSRK
jgi:hypothetical protein